jgi:hypothetical protein
MSYDGMEMKELVDTFDDDIADRVLVKVNLHSPLYKEKKASILL